MNETSFPSETAARLNGLFPPEFDTTQPVQMDIGSDQSSPLKWRSMGKIKIANARLLQNGIKSESDFFDEHGFILLNHQTAVQDWFLTSDPNSSEAKDRYFPEIETLVTQHLLPGKRVEVQQWWGPVLRGRDTPVPQYVNAVHSDHGLTAEDFEANLLAYADESVASRWRASYDRDDIESYMMIDFWRPTGMTEPLMHMPLAVCDPGSIHPTDLVAAVMNGISPSGKSAHQLMLRHNPDQRWYYYPGMRTDEVLAFRQFECHKDGIASGRTRSVFHSAFYDPATPANAEKRQSAEHRVGILVFRD